MITISLRKALLIILIFLFLVSLVFNIWLGYQIWIAVEAYKAQEINLRVLSFTEMFIEKVLMASSEVNFDTRLILETAVRSLDDQQIFDQWQRFTKSETKEQASAEAKFLLNLLVKKIKSPN